MIRPNVTRRDFLQKTALGASAFAAGIGAARGAEKKEEVVLGIIGVGGRGSRLLKYASQTEGVRIGAVCDLLTDRVAAGQRIAERHKPKGYTEFREMLAKEKLDGVIIATEVGNHAKVYVPVLEAGFNVFGEKPLETHVEKVDAIVKTARKAKGIFQVGFQRRYNDGFVKGMERLHSGTLGRVLFLQGHWHFPGGFGKWVVDVDMSGGRLVEQACHHMDVFAWTMKNQHPLECVGMAVTTIEHKNPPKYVSEDHSGLVFRFPGDVIFSYTHLCNAPDVWCGEKLWVYGEHWGMDLSKSELYMPEGKVEQFADPSDFYKGEDIQLAAFAHNIRKGGKDKVLSNVETARVATLMAIMGRTAFRNLEKNVFEPRVVKWEDLKSTTEPARL
jgi:predicted dehydrogenase